MTKKDYKKELEELEIDFDSNASKADLKEMYEGAIKQTESGNAFTDNDSELVEDDDITIEDDVVVELEPIRRGQASLADCNRQLQGKRPSCCSGK